MAGDYRFEFFANDKCDASGHGEGKEFIAAVEVNLASTGGAPFETTINTNIAPGKVITATATNLATRDTSEFANCAVVISAATPTATPPGQTATPTPTATPPGQTATPTPTATPPGQTATPTSTGTPPAGESVVWGDGNCSGSTDPVDSLLTLRFDAGLSTNTGDCPNFGQVVDVAFASPHIWGDIDCSGEVTPVDSLKVLRFDAGLSVTQEAECPVIGSEVLVVE